MSPEAAERRAEQQRGDAGEQQQSFVGGRRPTAVYAIPIAAVAKARTDVNRLAVGLVAEKVRRLYVPTDVVAVEQLERSVVEAELVNGRRTAANYHLPPRLLA